MSNVIRMAGYRKMCKFANTVSLAELYAIIKSDEDSVIHEKSKSIVENPRAYSERPTKLMQLRTSFEVAARHFAFKDNKQVNQECVDDIETFFLLASLSKYKTTPELAQVLGNVTPEVLESIAHFAKAQHKVNEQRRYVGRQLRPLGK